NGAGKTSLLRCINRVARGWRGAVNINGVSIAAFTQRELARHVAYVPQAGGRHSPFTVRETILMARYPHLTPFVSVNYRDLRFVEDALALTGTGSLADRAMHTLSGGERQKVMLAAALAQNARILLLDEPTTFLDPRHRDVFRRVLRTINREKGITVIEVTHDLNCAALDSHRILALRNGEIAFCGPPGQFMDNEVLSRLYERSFLFTEHPVTGQPMILPEEGDRI
ncbi:ABC transporter ATP-binding protein, partial [bacterium]|nr:ABC transporter ATP-binding protein [bacterium]